MYSSSTMKDKRSPSKESVLLRELDKIAKFGGGDQLGPVLAFKAARTIRSLRGKVSYWQSKSTHPEIIVNEDEVEEGDPYENQRNQNAP